MGRHLLTYDNEYWGIQKFPSRLLKRFKRMAAKRGLTIKQALIQAIQLWIRQARHDRTAPKELVIHENKRNQTI